MFASSVCRAPMNVQDKLVTCAVITFNIFSQIYKKNVLKKFFLKFVKYCCGEFGIHMYILLYLKWITNEVLLYSTGVLLSVMWWPGWEGSLGENGDIYIYTHMYIYMAESLFCPLETITTLLIGYSPI